MSLLELHNVRLLGLGAQPPLGQQQAQQQQQLQGFDHWHEQPWAGGEGVAGAGVVGGGGGAAASAAADVRPVVVLAHGFGTDQSCWQHVVPHLVGEYQVVLFDLMGAASTDPDHFCFARYSSLPAYAADLLSILDELRVERCLYVGHSMSGMIGCIASLQRPRLFAKIILLGASPRYINSPEYFGGFEQEDLNQLFLAMQTNYLDWAAGFAPLVIGADLESESVSEFSRTLFSLRPDIALNVARTVFQSDVRAILPQITTPVHILQAMKDLAVPECVSQYMHRALGGKSVVEILPTHGHLPQLSSPEVVVPALLRHLRSNL